MRSKKSFFFFPFLFFFFKFIYKTLSKSIFDIDLMKGVKEMRKIPGLVLIISLSLNTFAYGRSTVYGEAVISHMLTEDCKKSPDCINSILESELKYSTYRFVSEILGTMKEFLPDILDNAQRDIQRKLDEEYKSSL